MGNLGNFLVGQYYIVRLVSGKGQFDNFCGPQTDRLAASTEALEERIPGPSPPEHHVGRPTFHGKRQASSDQEYLAF